MEIKCLFVEKNFITNLGNILNLMVNGSTMKVSESAKYFRIISDWNLSLNEQIQKSARAFGYHLRNGLLENT